VTAASLTPGAVLDLRRYACPLTYVKTRIALEKVASHERIEVWLAPGEAVESVPRSAAEEGHRILGVEPLPDAVGYRVVIEKGVAAPGGLR
jgi:tRNA 2-thiouridine synthesizing protein A